MAASYQLNTMDSSINIHINSEDGMNFIGKGADSNLVQTSDFTMVLEDTIACDETQHMLLSVSSIEIPITFYNVSQAINNHNFVLKEGNFNIDITLPSQNYDIDSLQTQLETLFNNGSNVGATYIFKFDINTYKLTCTSSSTTTFKFDFTEYKETAKLLGFFPSIVSSQNQVLTSVKPINMNSIPFVFLDSSFTSKGSVISTNERDIKTFSSGVLAKVPVDKDFGDILTYTPLGNRHSLLLSGKRIHQLRLTLKDPNYRTIDLNGVPFSVSLSVDFIDLEAGGIYNTDDPRHKKITTTREDVNENLTQALMSLGQEYAENMDNRNKLIDVLNLDKPK